MEPILRILLPTYFIFYFGLAFVLKSALVARKIGKNPIVLQKDESALGLIGLYFKLTIIALFIYLMLYSFLPIRDEYYLPIKQLQNNILIYCGIALLVFALIWTIIAQTHMRNSWRIGIDQKTHTELITSGLFRISRNPIFLGMIVSLIGLFLTTPNAWTGLFLILSYILIQIQIRLEEEHLTKMNGQKYLDYKKRTRRFI